MHYTLGSRWAAKVICCPPGASSIVSCDAARQRCRATDVDYGDRRLNSPSKPHIASQELGDTRLGYMPARWVDVLHLARIASISSVPYVKTE